LNEKAFKFGDDNISPSLLGVGRHSLLLPLYDGMVRLDGTEEWLVLLEILEAPGSSKR
jgi:hypothetical protein